MPDIDVASKKEFFLDIDDYGEVASYEGILSVARQLQTLLILNPGSYPNHPDMGIGIENYIQEINDEKTLSELNVNINTQVSKYIPSNYIESISAEFLINETTGIKNSIGIKAQIIMPNDDKEIILTFEKESTSSKLLTKLYL